MKLFYKKDYEILKTRFEDLEKAYKELEILKNCLDEDLVKADVRYNHLFTVFKSDKEISEDEIKKLNGSIGGLTKENNKLKKENEDLANQIKELKSDRYLKRELKPQKSRITTKMGIKRGVTNLGVKAILKNKNELDSVKNE